MKKFFLTLFSAIALLAVSCTFDDSELWNEIDSLKDRVSALEQLCNQMNTNITSLQTIVEALQGNDYVTNIAPIQEGGNVVGYTITFAKSDSITIHLGGNASAPQIGVKKHKDGIYYWTLGGEWLLDGEGNKVKAQGNMPKLKVENGYWYVSYDNGASWSEVGKATGDAGDSMFADVTYDDDYVYITLANGLKFALPCRQIATNKIYYTSSDGAVVIPYMPGVFGANIVSNVYKNGRGVITFDGDVQSIGDWAFSACASLESITIPEGVTSIGYRAFELCSSLESITIPNSVTSIGNYAFNQCASLESITIPESVTSMGKFVFYLSSSLKAFYGKYASVDNRCWVVDGKLLAFAPAGLTSYTIPNGVQSIGDYVFSYCDALTSISLPDSVTEIGQGAFVGCSSLTKFYGKYASVDNRCWVVDGKLLAFTPAGLTSYTIPNGVQSIGAFAFQYCHALTSITLPDSITQISYGAFNQCSSLATVYSKPATPPTLGLDVFWRTSLSNIYVPTSSVSAYKAAGGWSSYASIIEGRTF